MNAPLRQPSQNFERIYARAIWLALKANQERRQAEVSPKRRKHDEDPRPSLEALRHFLLQQCQGDLLKLYTLTSWVGTDSVRSLAWTYAEQNALGWRTHRLAVALAEALPGRAWQMSEAIDEVRREGLDLEGSWLP